MIAAARAAQPDRRWIVGDIGEWVLRSPKPGEQVDLIFSSAALQWVDDHAVVFPRLIEKLAPGGMLAVQMPAYDAIPNRLMREWLQARSGNAGFRTNGPRNGVLTP
jgi:trans-aconitate 2-methyltransferase